MTFQLRDYQGAMLDETRALMRRGVKRILIQSATGSGKTALAATMLGTAAQRGLDSWFIVHRRELIKQSVDTFRLAGVSHGIIAAGWPKAPWCHIQIASVASVARRIAALPPPKLIVWDEAHHSPAHSWASIQAAFPTAFHIGLSATPCRLDGKGLSNHFDAMVCGPTVSSLIDSGWLSPFIVYAPVQPDLSTTHVSRGDYVHAELAEQFDRPSVTGDAVAHYLRLCRGKRALVFAFGIEHSRHIVDQFNAAGVRSEHVDGETETVARDASMRRFRSGETLVLSNVELFGEGVDVPACEVMIELRPTKSLALWLQHVGRVLRPAQGKTAIVLDHAGNTLAHGFPDDDREWSLDGISKSRKNSPSTVAVKICKGCFAAVRTTVRACPYCGHVFVATEREVAQLAGDLAPVDATAVRAARKVVDLDRATARTLEQLQAIERQRGYKPGWAAHVYHARQRKQTA